MARRNRIVALATLLFAALLTPTAITRASAGEEQSPSAAPATFDELTVTFAYPTSVGEAVSSDGRTREVTIADNVAPEVALAAWEMTAGVIAVIPQVEVTTTSVPSDPRYADQWDMDAPVPTGLNGGAANVAPIWSTATGDGAIVAVVDTGGTAHPDLVDAQPAGWGIDMVSDAPRALDGDGRDTDPTDPGDNCGWGSTWHGTHVAGTIAAQHNEIGVAGIAPNAQVMHVRVLGRCGGTFDDVIDGIRWAAGLPTTYLGATWASQGLPSNEHPADVINLSLGGGAPCFDTLQSTISEARAAGTLVIAAAGNSDRDASAFTPANCDGVITVAAVGRVGGRAYYSNFGSTVEIAAPGGDMSRDSGILSTIGVGFSTLTDYGYTNYQGTSMAAPHVAGVAALLFGLNPGTSPAAVESALLASTRAFPADSVRPCVSTTAVPTGAERQCGVGLLDATQALGFTVPVITLNAPAELVVDEQHTLEVSSDAVGEVSLGIDSASTSICSLSGTTVTALSVGTCVITASTPPAGTVAAGFGRESITIRGITQSISFDPEGVLSGTPIRYGDHPALTATTTSGLAVSFSGLPGSSCGVYYDLRGPLPVAHLGYTEPGACTIVATQSGSSRYRAAEPVERVITIARGLQSIGTNGLYDRVVGDTPAWLDTLSSRGLPISWSSRTPAVCIIELASGGALLRPIASGTCTVVGEQAGNTYFEPVTLTRSLTIARRAQAPLRLTLPNRIYAVGDRVAVGWGGGSTSSPLFMRSLTPKVCVMQGGAVRFVGGGTCKIIGNKAGNAAYLSASTSISRTVVLRARVTVAPRIRRTGTALYGSPGVWSLGTPRAVLDYTWFRCSSTRGGCLEIAGAKSLATPVVPAMRGWYVKLRVRATHLNQAWTEVESWSNYIYIPPK
ncbi:MAG: S8 family peptidase [Candidatus Limnocylindrus sp.]